MLWPAASNLPARSAWASVKEPFMWPNSSLSISSEGMAAQLTSTNGAAAVACGEGMYLAGKHLFACAVLAGDEDVGIGGRYLFYQHAKLLHDAAFSPVHGRSGACRRGCRFLPGCRGVLCSIQQGFH